MSNSNNQAPGEVLYVYPKKSYARWYNTYRLICSGIVRLSIHDGSGESIDFYIDQSKMPSVCKHHWYFKLGGKGGKYYAQRTYGPKGNSKIEFLHRHIYGDTLLDIDHEDRDTRNNLLSNLRECSRTQNMVNVVLSNKRDLPQGGYTTTEGSLDLS